MKEGGREGDMGDDYCTRAVRQCWDCGLNGERLGTRAVLFSSHFNSPLRFPSLHSLCPLSLISISLLQSASSFFCFSPLLFSTGWSFAFLISISLALWMRENVWIRKQSAAVQSRQNSLRSHKSCPIIEISIRSILPYWKSKNREYHCEFENIERYLVYQIIMKFELKRSHKII